MKRATRRAEPVEYLLDGNVLVALADAAHVHHSSAVHWFTSSGANFATCPMTQGTLLRMLVHFNAVPDLAAAVSVLERFTAHPRHRFWPDNLSYPEISWKGVLGQRQVTDAYLAGLARHRGARVATFDKGLAALHAESAELLEIQ